MPPHADTATWPARLRAQLLTEPTATDPVAVVGHLLAVQAQDPRAMRLAIRSRSTGLVASDVDRALTEDRTLVLTWLNRGTLHLVTADDFWWLHDITAPRSRTWNRTRLQQEGVSATQAQRGVEVVASALASGPHTRLQLRALLDDAGVPTAKQALVHVLTEATLERRAVRGPVVDGELAYVDPDRWLGPAPAALDTDEALARLAARYLAGHSPAHAADLAKWAGITLTAARAAMTSIDAQPEPEPPEAPAPPNWPSPRLLGGFDPILHGWADRTGITGPHRSIVTTNGIFRPIALVDGRAVATWTLAKGTLSITPLESITSSVADALLDDATRVLSYLELPATPAVVV
jgi:hypothetical protein